VPRITRMRRLMVLVICCMSLFIVGLDNTIVNIALPTIARGLNASVSGLQWIVDGYTMVLASLLMFAGAAADRFGRRRVFQVGLAIFTVASALCSVAPDLGWLVAFRVIQAVGGSMLNPVAMSIISSVYTTRSSRTRAIGVWVSVFGVSMALGPVLGGLLTSTVGWRAIFWVNLPVGFIAMILAYMLVPESRARRPRRTDLVGQFLVIGLLGSVIYATIEGARTDWHAIEIRGLFGVGAGMLAVLVMWELHREDPLIDPRCFRSPALTGAVLIAVGSFACLGGFLFLATIYLQDVRDLPVLHAGMDMLPAAIAIAVFPSMAAWLADKSGPRIPLTLGGLALAVSTAAMSQLSGTSKIEYLIAVYAAFGLGFAMVDGQISGAAIAALPAAQSGLASGIASTGRQVGQALGVAVSGALLDANLHGSMRGGFATASRPAWSVLTGCGCVVLVLGLAAATLGRVPYLGAGVPSPREEATQPLPRLREPAMSQQPTEWIPRYLMNYPAPDGDQGQPPV
jgi:EmrB/QacA subfamily drug resistance transporter